MLQLCFVIVYSKLFFYDCLLQYLQDMYKVHRIMVHVVVRYHALCLCRNLVLL